MATTPKRQIIIIIIIIIHKPNTFRASVGVLVDIQKVFGS